jgi:hypothetical protein
MMNTTASSPTTHAACNSPGGMSTASPGDSSTSDSDALVAAASARSAAAAPLHPFGRMMNFPPSAMPTRL